jgi:hypothetical protein
MWVYEKTGLADIHSKSMHQNLRNIIGSFLIKQQNVYSFPKDAHAVSNECVNISKRYLDKLMEDKLLQ